jgi:hypothetical protein
MRRHDHPAAARTNIRADRSAAISFYGPDHSPANDRLLPGSIRECKGFPDAAPRPEARASFGLPILNRA